MTQRLNRKGQGKKMRVTGKTADYEEKKKDGDIEPLLVSLKGTSAKESPSLLARLDLSVQGKSPIRDPSHQEKKG